jgi:hypothetical protein
VDIGNLRRFWHSKHVSFYKIKYTKMADNLLAMPCDNINIIFIIVYWDVYGAEVNTDDEQRQAAGMCCSQSQEHPD